jgi:transposase
MKQVTYAGLDVHKNSITAVFGPMKTEPEAMRVKNDPKGWEMLAKRLEGFEVRAVYEASSCGFELYDEMTARGWSVVVVAPSMMPTSTKRRKVKTDLRDAVELRSQLLASREAGASLPTVWIPPEVVRQDRELVRRRLAVGKQVSRLKSSIKNLLQIHKVRVQEEFASKWSQAYVGWLEGLCEGTAGALAETVRTVLGSLLRDLEFQKAEEKVLQKELERLTTEARHKAQVTEVRKVAGVGILTALTFLTELGDVTRFQNRKQLGSYLGLTPASYESGEADDRKGHITRLGPSRIRKVLNQAAWCAIRLDPHRRARFAGTAMRTGSKKAIVAEMRRLGIELWHRALTAQPA